MSLTQKCSLRGVPLYSCGKSIGTHTQRWSEPHPSSPQNSHLLKSYILKQRAVLVQPKPLEPLEQAVVFRGRAGQAVVAGVPPIGLGRGEGGGDGGTVHGVDRGRVGSHGADRGEVVDRPQAG